MGPFAVCCGAVCVHESVQCYESKVHGLVCCCFVFFVCFNSDHAAAENGNACR